MDLAKLPEDKFIEAHKNALRITDKNDDSELAENLALKVYEEYMTMGMEVNLNFIRSVFMQILSKDKGMSLMQDSETCKNEFYKLASETRFDIERSINTKNTTDSRGDDMTIQIQLGTSNKHRPSGTRFPDDWFEKEYKKSKSDGIGFVEKLTTNLAKLFETRGLDVNADMIGFFLSEMISKGIDIKDPVACKRALIEKLETRGVLIFDKQGMRLTSNPPKPTINTNTDEFGLPINAFKKAHEKATGSGTVYVESLTDQIVDMFKKVRLEINWQSVKDELVAIVIDRNKEKGGWGVVTDAEKCKERLYAQLKKKMVP